MAKWILKNKKANIDKMSKEFNLSKIVCQILVNRNINTRNSIIKYINSDFKYIDNSIKMKDMKKAITLLSKCIDKNCKIAIYGDYDVDGTMSTTILFKGLENLGAEVIYYIPDREKEGYGLNTNAIKILKELEVDIIITCDNGIVALKEIKYAKLLDIKIIVIDHHEPSSIKLENNNVEILPEADAIINPKQSCCNYKFKNMCAAGLSYIFIKTLYDYRKKILKNNEELIVLSMIATFCDIVDLQGENRILVKNGLKILNKNKKINLGLSYLLKEKEYDNKEIDEFTIGFIIGPCINAAGRLEHASAAVKLFLSKTQEEAEKLSRILINLNEDRKKMTLESVNSIMKNLYNNKDKVIIVYNDKIHESIAGIIAGRIRDKLYKPTIILSKSGNIVKGSGRSIEAYNLFEALNDCVELFEKFGGHAMAAGFSIKEENISKLKIKLNNKFNLKKDELIEIIKIDKKLDFEDITYELAKEIKILKPFGKNNKEPIFGSKNIKVYKLKLIEEKDTIIFTFNIGKTYRYIKGICFGKVENFKEIIEENFNKDDIKKIFNNNLENINLNLDVVYFIDINNYNGSTYLQLKIIDFRMCK